MRLATKKRLGMAGIEHRTFAPLTMIDGRVYRSASLMGYMGGPSFHPDSWDFDAGTYAVRDASEETIAQLAAFYGGTVHDINMVNLKYNGDPQKYGAVVGTIINMPPAMLARALAMDCPPGFSRNAKGYCVADTSQGGKCPAGWAVDANGQCYDPAKGPPPAPPGPGQVTSDTDGLKTWQKWALGTTAVAAVAGIGFGAWRAFNGSSA